MPKLIDMKYKIFILAIFAIWTDHIDAQFFNNGAQITTQENAIIHIQGDFIHQDGIIENSGLIEVGTNWMNLDTNNPIVDTDGIISLVGTNQLIGGSTESSFNELHLNGAGEKTLEQNIQINSRLDLVDALLILNEKRATINNGANTAIERNNGRIISEDTETYGWLQWNIGMNAGDYEVPFGTLENDIPLHFNVVNNGMGNGNISFATYPTSTDNNPLPNGVTNLDVNGEDDALKMADRFWLVEDAGYMTPPTADIQFTYNDADILAPNTIDADLLQVAQWNGSTAWDTLFSTVDNNNISVLELNEFGVFTLRSKEDPTSIFSINTPLLGFDIYPNPIQANAPLTITLESKSSESALIYLLDAQGRLLEQKTNMLLAGSNHFNFNTPNVPAGNYLLIIESAGKIGAKKIFINN